MRWTLISLVGLVTGFAAWQSGPMFYPSPADGIVFLGTAEWIWYELVIISFYAPFIVAVLGGTLGVFRALSLTTRRAELASLIALGRTRRSLLSDHTRAGVRDGAIASSAVVLATVGRQATVGLNGVEFVPSVAIGAVMLIVATLVSFTLAYWLSAWWATRGSVRDVASGTIGQARPHTHTNGKLYWARRAWVWVVLGVIVASVITHFGPVNVQVSSEGIGLGSLVNFVTATIASFTVFLLAPAALAVGGAKVAIWVARRGIKSSAHKNAPGSARSLAADGLARRTPLRTAAATAIVLVMGASVAITATTFAKNDEAKMVGELVPPMYISTVDLEGDLELHEPGESGWAQALPADLVAELQAEPGLTVVETAVLITDPSASSIASDPEGNGSRGMYLAVDPDALDAMVPHASKRLYMLDSVVLPWGQYGWPEEFNDGASYLVVNGERTEVAMARTEGPWTGMSRPWAEQVWGPAPTSAVLLYRTGDLPVEFVLRDYAVQGFAVGGGSDLGWYSSTDGVAVAAVTAPFMAIAVALVIGLAWSGQRLRARDQATLLALGAKPVALRYAATIESGALTLAATATGVLGGALIGPTWAATTAAPVRHVPIDVVLWNIGQNFLLVPWGVIIGLAVGSAVLAAAGTLLIRVRLEQRTPAEQLTEAERSGIA